MTSNQRPVTSNQPPAASRQPPTAIRAMVVADIARVLEIEALSLPSVWSAVGYERELVGNGLAHYWVMVVPAGAIIGYFGYWLVGDEMQVSIIAVHPDWRGQGLGERLLQAGIGYACEQGATWGTLELREHNRAALGLYRKHGFEVVGERKNYYKDTGETALLMTAVELVKG